MLTDKGMFFACFFCRVCRQRKCLLTHWGAMVTLHFSSQYLEVGNCPRHSAGTQSHDCHMYHMIQQFVSHDLQAVCSVWRCVLSTSSCDINHIVCARQHHLLHRLLLRTENQMLVSWSPASLVNHVSRLRIHARKAGGCNLENRSGSRD